MKNTIPGGIQMTNKQCKALLKAIEIIVDTLQDPEKIKSALADIQNALSERQ